MRRIALGSVAALIVVLGLSGTGTGADGPGQARDGRTGVTRNDQTPDARPGRANGQEPRADRTPLGARGRADGPAVPAWARPLPSSTPSPTPEAQRTRQRTLPRGQAPVPQPLPGTSATPAPSGADLEDLSNGAVHPPMPLPEMPPLPTSGAAAPSTMAARPLVSALPEAPGPLSPPVATDFAALGDNSRAIPPDTHGAVGPNDLMVMLNTQVRVQSRTGTTRSTVPLNGTPFVGTGFWYAVNPNDANAFDPRIHYDPSYGGHWVAVVADEPFSTESALLLAVSQTTDPTLTWWFWRIPVDPVDQLAWADFPTLGLNNLWVVLQVNLFNITGGAFNRTQIYAIDKAQLYAGTLSHPPPIESSTISGTQFPATTYDSGVNDLYLLQLWNSGAGQLQLWKLTGPVALPSLVPVSPVTGPSWSNEGAGGADFAPQLQYQVEGGCLYCTPVGSCTPPARKIQTDDSRILGLVYRNGKLWAVQTVHLPAGSPNRSSIQWWELDTSGNVLQRGLIDDPTPSRFFAYPSIAVNKHEDVLIGYSSFEGSQYVSGSYSFRSVADPASTVQSEYVFHPGEACYYKDFTKGLNRWGDYSQTVVDPTDDVKLWTIQEYAAASAGPGEFDDRWGTWWAMVDTTRQIQIDDVTMNEGDGGQTDFVFTLTLTDSTGAPMATAQTVTVQWATQDNTATTADSDYQGASGTVTFNPGETTQTLVVKVNGDLKLEGPETFFVNLTSPTNAIFGDSQGLGTILNDDPTPQISIGDVTMREGTVGMGSPTLFVFPVTLSNPSNATIDVDWTTVDGTAVAGSFGTEDYAAAAGTVTFNPGVVAQTVTVAVYSDANPEPPPDKVFYVDLSLAGAPATLLKARSVGRIQDDDVVNPGVSAFTIVSDSVGSAATDGRNRLQWLNPSGVSPSQVLIKYNEGATCTAPATAAGGTGSIPVSPVAVGSTQSYVHTGLTLDRQYCYSAFVEYLPGPVYSSGAEMSARPFDSTGNVKWKLFTPSLMTALAPPTVGLDAVIGLSNDGYVQAMQRGATGGIWPGPWKPLSLGDVAQHRAPVVPLPGGSRAFISTQYGWVYAVDTANGNLVWSTQLPEGAAQGAPAGIFTAFGGKWNYILVGTSAGANNRFYALDPATGAVIDAFPGPADAATGSIGAILGAAAVDYRGNGRVYFASRKDVDIDSLWCLDLGPASDALRLAWKSSIPGAINGSPVLANGRVYVIDDTGTAWSYAADGSGGYSLSLGDGDGKGFLFPDRASTDLYVATQTQVHALTDNVGTSLVNKPGWATPFTVPAPGHPSVVLLRPGTNELYVGVDQDSSAGIAAGLLRINANDGTFASAQQLEATPLVIGAPSLDIGQATPVIHVGSEAGIFYAVELGF
jgi:hypothetical protein